MYQIKDVTYTNTRISTIYNNLLLIAFKNDDVKIIRLDRNLNTIFSDENIIGGANPQKNFWIKRKQLLNNNKDEYCLIDLNIDDFKGRPIKTGGWILPDKLIMTSNCPDKNDLEIFNYETGELVYHSDEFPYNPFSVWNKSLIISKSSSPEIYYKDTIARMDINSNAMLWEMNMSQILEFSYQDNFKEKLNDIYEMQLIPWAKVINGNILCSDSRKTLFSLNADTGEINWFFNVLFLVGDHIINEEKNEIVVFQNRVIEIIDSNSGKLLRKFHMTLPEFEKYGFNAFEIHHGRLLILGNYNFRDTIIGIVDLENGEVEWVKEFPNLKPFIRISASDDFKFIACSGDRIVYLLERETFRVW